MKCPDDILFCFGPVDNHLELGPTVEWVGVGTTRANIIGRQKQFHEGWVAQNAPTQGDRCVNEAICNLGRAGSPSWGNLYNHHHQIYECRTHFLMKALCRHQWQACTAQHTFDKRLPCLKFPSTRLKHVESDGIFIDIIIKLLAN